ncbi:hypothetical protein BH11GEM1_BH11GEM1_24190 [soil metagenome]
MRGYVRHTVMLADAAQIGVLPPVAPTIALQGCRRSRPITEG